MAREPGGCSRRAAAAASLAAALLAAGCALAPKFETPQLSVVGVELVKSDLWEQRLKVRMRVQNPNPRTLPVKAITYTLDVEGQQLASGESDASFVVPASGEAEFDMSVTTNLAVTLLKLLARGSDAMQTVPYRLSGTLSLSEGWLRSVPFQQQGTFKLQ